MRQRGCGRSNNSGRCRDSSNPAVSRWSKRCARSLLCREAGASARAPSRRPKRAWCPEAPRRSLAAREAEADGSSRGPVVGKRPVSGRRPTRGTSRRSPSSFPFATRVGCVMLAGRLSFEVSTWTGLAVETISGIPGACATRDRSPWPRLRSVGTTAHRRPARAPRWRRRSTARRPRRRRPRTAELSLPARRPRRDGPSGPITTAPSSASAMTRQRPRVSGLVGEDVRNTNRSRCSPANRLVLWGPWKPPGCPDDEVVLRQRARTGSTRAGSRSSRDRPAP
jgi:hypothetical protein